ncbi:hypothetical protein N7448_006837 [Penicillium atrosanguineum]|uniref:Uncharacterized protein n=1 Tax=Penicillium atrosanguineum TaxID=1132637 RepID=A0A9W9PV82_9EURO|nr:uncharacterized protein N7443_010598 [Penicillium atrosanguineum]KAJ5132679.1 hypothetical protein N7448_006837 [Penicillium atrosanguineum]KAJ5141436.1 hypothetical protein N7526_002431 [Penicillium atrosanguineum]KAJ5290345.1 hypothetical protein N7443_010598 [Penicillium atrosanguineum]KAJ5308168.1 hypothetical protein N7476_008824 [Penicillium atrosanguineum]
MSSSSSHATNAITNLNLALILPTNINHGRLYALRNDTCMHIDLKIQLARDAVACKVHTLTTTVAA